MASQSRGKQTRSSREHRETRCMASKRGLELRHSPLARNTSTYSDMGGHQCSHYRFTVTKGRECLHPGVFAHSKLAFAVCCHTIGFCTVLPQVLVQLHQSRCSSNFVPHRNTVSSLETAPNQFASLCRSTQGHKPLKSWRLWVSLQALPLVYRNPSVRCSLSCSTR